jgi:flavin reductase (DIM6/NTAB) family NADH-FMN oxidoreductase RutF
MSVSNTPPLIGVSVRTGSKTDAVLKNSKNFSVNWLGYSERKYIDLLAKGGDSPDKLTSNKIPFDEIMDAPVLKKSAAYAICQKESVHQIGDHELFVGLVIGSMASLDFDENWKFNGYRPILYLGSESRKPYATLPRAR